MLTEVPIVLILVGLAAYTVLAGADFGAGFWILFAGGGRAGAAATRDHARHAMGPVWEANHVWLIFILVVCWTAYPVAFGSIMSTLAMPLFVATIGIILRGASYALRGQLDAEPAQRSIERVFALSSVLTPFALGRTRPPSSSVRSRSRRRAIWAPSTSPPMRNDSASRHSSTIFARVRCSPRSWPARSPSRASWSFATMLGRSSTASRAEPVSP